MFCELLSNYYLCSGKNNALFVSASQLAVVNCFRITIFAVAKTIATHRMRTRTSLWIAFELLSLQWQKQSRSSKYWLYTVVNCFRITIFAVAKTMSPCCPALCPELWIAFELLSLQWQKQCILKNLPRFISCELLSNYYLCSGKNNN